MRLFARMARRRGKAAGGGGGATLIFSDNLEGGAYNDAGGFTWAPQAKWSVSSDYAFDGGTHAFKATLGPDDADVQGDQSAANLQFNLNQDVSELSVEWKQLFPSNYEHRIIVGNSENNKIFGMWRDSINNMNSFRFLLETNPTDTGVTAATSVARAAASSSTDNLLDTAMVQTTYITPSGPIIPGTAATMRVHIKTASGAGANDGRLRWWANGTLLTDVSSADFWNQNGTYPNARLNLGYFMGSQNSGYTSATTFYLGAFKFYTGNQFGG